MGQSFYFPQSLGFNSEVKPNGLKLEGCLVSRSVSELRRAAVHLLGASAGPGGNRKLEG